jgi:hypothetical protein
LYSLSKVPPVTRIRMDMVSCVKRHEASVPMRREQSLQTTRG